MKLIPLHAPTFNQQDQTMVSRSVKSGWVTNKGNFLTIFTNKLSKIFNNQNISLTINGTSALHIALKVAGIKPHEEVLVPSLTFISTVNSIIYCNAKPVFLDSDDTLSLCPSKLKNFLEQETFVKKGTTFNKKTKKKISALIAVSLYGSCVDIKEIKRVTKGRGIKIIEDISESLGTYYTKDYFNNNHVGTQSEFSCLSFNGNKIITSAGGGAIIAKSKSDILKCKYLCNQAKDKFIYSKHDDIGFNYGLSNLHASLGVSQLSKLNFYLAKKKYIHKNYKKLLNNNRDIEVFTPPTICKSNYWLNLLIFKNISKDGLNKLTKRLLKEGYETRTIWRLNHTQKPFLKYQSYKIKNAHKIVNSHLCIPSSPGLSFSEQKKLIDKIIN